jgi:hypothetical protein
MPHSALMKLQSAMLAVSLLIAAAASAATADDAMRRNDPVALANARELIESRRDPQVRARVLNEMARRDRPQWTAIAPQIGLEAGELDWFLAVRAQRRLVNEQREAHCWLDSACNPFEFIPGWRDPFDDLSSQLGKERFERYQLVVTARDERAYLVGLQKRLPATDPLSDTVIEQLAQALIDGRTQFAREARQLGTSVQVHLIEQPTMHLWSAYNSNGAWDKRKETAARYAQWLEDVASRHLSAGQFADFKAMLERETAAHDTWLVAAAAQRVEIKAGFDPFANKNGRPPEKNPGLMARARFNLTDQRFQIDARARFIREAHTYWTERAGTTLLALSPRELEQMAETLGELEYRQELLLMACITDPDCDENATRASHKEARHLEAGRIMGAGEFAHFNRANGADSQTYYNIRDFLDELPIGNKLSHQKARLLAQAVAAEDARRREAGRDESRTDRMASAMTHVQRLHAIAGKFLDREQLRLFDAMQRRENGILSQDP